MLGMICIRPVAPTGETASGRKVLSVRMTAQSRFGSRRWVRAESITRSEKARGKVWRMVRFRGPSFQP